MNGFLVIDKPGGMTSRDVVNRVQKWFPRKTKIGHTGTLDPLATGVLVICIGAATRLADYVQRMSKSYMSRFRLGATSTTDDADGIVTSNPVVSAPTRERIERELASFIGTIEQIPPAFSALKVEGQRAHELARRGNEVKLEARLVRIDAIRMQAYEWPYLDLEVECGKGTYIRSIASDLGVKLGCGGMVQTLRRTRIGPFTADQGIGVETDPGDLKIFPLIAALPEMPRVQIGEEAEKRLRQGQGISAPEASYLRDNPSEELAILNETGDLIGIGVLRQGLIRPTLVINS